MNRKLRCSNRQAKKAVRKTFRQCMYKCLLTKREIAYLECNKSEMQYAAFHNRYVTNLFARSAKTPTFMYNNRTTIKKLARESKRNLRKYCGVR